MKDKILKHIGKAKWTHLDMFMVIMIELLIFYASMPLIRLFVPEDALLNSIFVFCLYIFQTVVTLGVLYYFTMYKYGTKISDFGFKKIKIKKSLLFVFGAWLMTIFLLMLMSTIMIAIMGGEVPGFMQQEEHIPIFGNNSVGYFGLIISAFIIAPITEEVVFRGFILKGLLKYVSPLSSILISSVLFSLLHFEFSSVIPLFIIGCILGWIFLERKSIYDCLLFHAFNNGFALIAEFFLSGMI